MLAIRPLHRYPAKPLREPSARVDEFNEDLYFLVAQLEDTMLAYRAAGIAAPQLGVLKRVFVLSPTAARRALPLAIINPEIVERSSELIIQPEGCLSLPGIVVHAKRAARVRVKATDLDGKPIELDGDGLLAQALQHEIDHLDGRLLVDYAGRVKREMIERRMRGRR
jgi:peptide deformylase